MKKVAKWLCVAILTPILLFLILTVLFYLPPVQNWVADKVAAIASEKTGMEISVGTVRLEWPLDLGIDDFLMLNMWNDTVAYTGHLTVDVQLLPLFNKRVVINEVHLQHAVFDTYEAISDMEISGRVGELWLRSNGIDLDKETVEVNGARLQDADLDIALSDTAAVDTTSSNMRWRINADSLSIYHSAIALHLPGDTLGVSAYIWHSAMDERTRHSHAGMNGVLCFYSDPPNPEALFPGPGQKAYGAYHAGNTFNCRCWQEPVVEWSFLPDSIKVHDHGRLVTMTREAIIKKYA